MNKLFKYDSEILKCFIFNIFILYKNINPSIKFKLVKFDTLLVFKHYLIVRLKVFSYIIFRC